MHFLAMNGNGRVTMDGCDGQDCLERFKEHFCVKRLKKNVAQLFGWSKSG